MFHTKVVHGYKPTLEKYLADLETSSVRNLQELIKFNEDNADKELPEGLRSYPRTLVVDMYATKSYRKLKSRLSDQSIDLGH